MKEFENIPEQSLTPEEENILAERKTEESQIALTMSRLKEAAVYLRYFFRSSVENSEIISLAYEALMKAAKNFSGGRFWAVAKPYLRGEFYKHYRNSKKYVTLPEVPPDDEEGYGPREDDWHEFDFPLIFLKEGFQQIPALLKRLRPQERLVLEMRYEAGMNFQEIANVLGVARQGVQHTHKRAITKLQTWIR